MLEIENFILGIYNWYACYSKKKMPLKYWIENEKKYLKTFYINIISLKLNPKKTKRNFVYK